MAKILSQHDVVYSHLAKYFRELQYELLLHLAEVIPLPQIHGPAIFAHGY